MLNQNTSPSFSFSLNTLTKHKESGLEIEHVISRKSQPLVSKQSSEGFSDFGVGQAGLKVPKRPLRSRGPEGSYTSSILIFLIQMSIRTFVSINYCGRKCRF